MWKTWLKVLTGDLKVKSLILQMSRAERVKVSPLKLGNNGAMLESSIPLCVETRWITARARWRSVQPGSVTHYNIIVYPKISYNYVADGGKKGIRYYETSDQRFIPGWL